MGITVSNLPSLLSGLSSKKMSKPEPEPRSLNIVKIRDLQPIKDRYGSRDYIEIIKRLNEPEHLLPQRSYSQAKKYTSRILAYYKNIEINHPGGSSLLSAFMQAYNNHEDITLFPDDVWITILFMFSKYVKNNSEKLRDKFVSFEGKKELTVTVENESEWNKIFDQMIIEIKQNTNDGIVDQMQCTFSTTGLVEKIISTATVMDSFKSYFDYGVCIPLCGIRNVCFGGTLEDWQSIKSKLDFLKEYDLEGGKWANYVKNLEPIIDQFIETYKGNVDTVFWDKVMNLKKGSRGSGSTTYISGWILAFYGLYDPNSIPKSKITIPRINTQTLEEEETEIEGFDMGDLDFTYTLDVPIKVDNKVTGIVKTVRLRATFGGLNKTNGSYRPQLSMIVCELDEDNDPNYLEQTEDED